MSPGAFQMEKQYFFFLKNRELLDLYGATTSWKNGFFVQIFMYLYVFLSDKVNKLIKWIRIP